VFPRFRRVLLRSAQPEKCRRRPLCGTAMWRLFRYAIDQAARPMAAWSARQRRRPATGRH